MMGVADLSIPVAFALGVMGSGHCVAMCSGIACGLGMSRPPRSCLIGYQLGRVTGYAAVGAVVAGLAGGLVAGANVLELGSRLASPVHLLQSLVLIVLGCHLAGIWRAPLSAIERLGSAMWRHAAPLSRRLMPVRHPAQAFAFGLLWGLLPCPLVYGALALAAVSANAIDGAAHMAAFGLGTVPAVLAMSMFARRLGGTAITSWLRRAAGAVLIAFGAVAGYMAGAHAGM